MKIKIWCKAFLNIYHIIPNIVNSIDKLVLLKGVNSSYFCNGQINSTLSQFESIMSLTQKKVCLINLKVLTDEVLLEMKKDSSKLLILRFINNVGCKKAIELSNKPRRSYFRALNRALKEFESLFYSKILSNKVLYESLNGEMFLEEVFEKINLFEKKSNNEDCFLNYSDNICSFIVNKIKKIV